MSKQMHSTLVLRLMIAVLLAALLLPAPVVAIPASPGDGDNDGIITGPRLVGNTTYRGCFASGPDPSGAADPDWDKDVDTITGALKGTGSWTDANMTKLKNGKRADIEACVNAAKAAAEPGDEFIFYFSGHGGNGTFQDGVQDQHETAADPNDDPDDFDNHILLGDTTAGTRSRMSDDELAKLLSGFKRSVTIVVILDSCNSHTFSDGSADLGSVTQVDPDGNNVPATNHLALIAASTTANPTCSAGMTDRIADGLSLQGAHLKADKNGDGVVTAKEIAAYAKAYLPELKPKCDEADPHVCPMPDEPGATYRGPLPPEVDNCPTVPNPSQQDTDGDYYGDVCDDDDDGDGLTDVQETGEYETNPLKADTDDDGMPDGYEVRFPCLDVKVNDGMADPDGDNASSLAEYQQGADPCTAGLGNDYGDAPEGGLAYPAAGVPGAFPTCKTVTAATWVQHGLGWARFVWPGAPQLAWDAEVDGNAGLCPNCFPAYDADECYRDGDAGLMFPQPYTIDNSLNVATCPNSLGTALGVTCQTASWGINSDIWIVNTMPVAGYVNVLMDWDQNGRWAGAATCPGGLLTPEHVLVNWPVPVNYSGPLSALQPPPFAIGPNNGHVWTRFTITERPVNVNWNGEGIFEDGESEDYLLRINTVALDFGDAPDPRYPTLVASNGARHVIVAGFHLGANIDAELDGQPDPNALGDDLNPLTIDDEDGVVFTTALIAGQAAAVNVTASAAGALDAWVDFNADGDWADTGEQIFAGAALSAGVNALTFTAPTYAVVGSTFARFRFSSAGGLSYAGLANDGEAEDYRVDILPPIVVTKTLLTPPTAAISDTVRFEIVVANHGNTTITTLPLYDYYSPACLENPVAQPPANGVLTNAALGILHWSNLAPVGGLLPNGQVKVTVDFHANITDAMYWKEGGWIDYAPKGMPDFTQKQNGWSDPFTGRWYYCGPVAAADSLWWFDSKFEPNPTPPPALNDGYPLVQAPPGALYDDHDPQNVQPLANTLAGLMGTTPATGTHVVSLAGGIQAHINNQGLANDYTVILAPRPSLAWVEDEVRRSEDVILLLGFWQELPPGSGNFERIGGHYVTVAGIDSLNKTIAFSDPYRDHVEEVAGAPGRVLPAPHQDLHGVLSPIHNDAQYASHDLYGVLEPSPSPGGVWSLPEYAENCQLVGNFQGQNAGQFPNGPTCQPGWPIYTEVEYAVAVSPLKPTVTCDPTTNIAVVRGAMDASGLMLPAAQAHTSVRVIGAAGLDFGDAPDPSYPTFRANNGARHAVGNLRLGNIVDTEGDGQPVDQDDVLPPLAPDDEDGVIFLGAGPAGGGPYALPYVAGQNGAVRILATGLGNGFLHGWFDWNQDGDWNDLGENVFSGYGAAAGGVYTIDFAVPAGAKPGRTWARFRLDDQNLNSPVGAASNGEVEDYPVEIAALPSVSVSKTILAPDNRTVFLIGETVTFDVVVANTGATRIDFLPLTDWFDTRCLTYSAKQSEPEETSYDNGAGRVDWSDLTLLNAQDLAPGQSFLTRINFTVTGASDQGFNKAEVSGALDQYQQAAPYAFDRVTFTCVQPASIGDWVWRDVDLDGIQDAGEAGIPNVAVKLYDAANVLVGTDTTDANGYYGFNSLTPGSYYLEFGLPTGYKFTLPDVDDGNPNPDARDSDVDPATGRTAVFVLAPGQNDLTRDAGMYKTGAVGGTVWKDLDGDQSIDVGEPPYQGATVILSDLLPAIIATTTTDGNGAYLFTGLTPGVYLVTVDRASLPAGLVLTTDDDPITVTIGEGQTVSGADFGFAEPVSIGDYLFIDQDPVTGVPGAEDVLGVGGVGITLTDNVRALVHTTISQNDGSYGFTGLPPGNYTIAVSIPAWLQMTTTPHPQTFQINSGQSDLARDFGFQVTTAVALQHLAARRVGNRVQVEWVTAFEVDNVGFHVWRASAATGPYQRLTAQPIPSQGVGGTGGRYRYYDSVVQPGQAYWYRLATAPSGEVFGPVSAAADGRWLQFMPLVRSKR